MTFTTISQEDLVTALKEGRVDKVTSLLQNDPDFLTTPEPQPWLHLAINAPANCRRLLRLLLEAGLSTDIPDKAGVTALHLAANKGRVKCLQELLQWKASVDIRDDIGHTPLHYATFSRHRKALTCIHLLIRAGASRNVRTNKGFTPLHVAAEVGNVAAARALLDEGASPTVTDNIGRTSLHLASTTEMVEILLSAGADVTWEDAEGVTPLDRAIHHFPALAPTLLGAGVAVQGDRQDSDLRVFFHFNIISRQQSEVKLLNTMSHKGHYDLLKHPLCETFLHLKWLLVYPLLYLKWIIFTGVVASLTASVCLRASLPFPQTTESDKAWRDNNYSVLTSIIVLQVVSAFLLALLVARMVMQMLVLRSLLWRRVDKCMELVFTVCSAILLAMKGPLEHWERHLGTLTLLLGWYNVTVLVGDIPSVGIYVQMFHTVARRIIKFTAVFSSLIIGFAISFHLAFEKAEAFQTVWLSSLKVLAMMVGELDFHEILGTNASQALPVTSEVVFVAFVLLITIVIANLLVGLAVQDIHDLWKVAGVRRLALTVEHEASVDLMLSSRLFTCLLSHKLLAHLTKRFSLLQQFPSRFLSLLTPRKHTLATLQWWTFKEAAYKKYGQMNRFNVFIRPYDPVDPEQVYCKISRKQEGIPSGYKLPSWIIRNTKIFLENGIRLGTSRAELVQSYDSDESSNCEGEDSINDNSSWDAITEDSFSEGDNLMITGFDTIDAVANKTNDILNISSESDHLSLVKLQDQINDLKQSIANINYLAEGNCKVKYETTI
nr:transient receptor potential channel pyrexia-like [Cherax quadricarinatus]